MLHKLVRLASFLCLSALTVSGCSQQAPAADAGSRGEVVIIGYEAMQQEFQESVDKLEWPQGFNVPQKVEGESTSDDYQKGYGDTEASMAYECAWAKEWLDSYSTDPNRAEKALSQLEKVPSMPYMSKERADDATRRFFKDYLDRAKLGDPSGFQENVTSNCR